MRLTLHLVASTGIPKEPQFNVLEEGDIEEAINAAGAIGDDRLQRMSGRRINPDSFTHGSSTQRMEWFQRGLKSGDLKNCNSFGS